MALLLGITLLFGCDPGMVAVQGSPERPGRARSQGRTPYAGKIGVGLEGAGNRGQEFVDVMKASRAWEKVGGGEVAVDERGWPKSDARTVVFDMRPVMAWAPPMDDPDAYQIDVFGTYKLSLEGVAKVEPATESAGVRVANLRHDAAKNRTTADVVVPKGQPLLILNFTGTKDGVRNVRLTRPGYAADSKEVFHRPFLRALVPFPVLRFMDWLDTNGANRFYGDAKKFTDWTDRRLPDDASQTDGGGKHGVAWEYVVALANQTGKDIWINVPAPASDSYVRELAKMMKRGLKPGIKVYTEYSNEVWNWGFLQSTYNRMAAEDEVARGGSILNRDGNADNFDWTRRRYAKRTIEIGRIFAEEFGAGSLNARIRPVLCWQIVAPDQIKELLDWINATYGPPKQHIYAVAGAPYFNTHGAPATASVADLLKRLREDSDQSAPAYRAKLIANARVYGLHPFCYEGGPDSGGGSPVNVANRIRAHRHPEMRELVRRDLKENWFDLGGDLFMYFTLSSPYSRYGNWGLTDDITKTDTPKFKAVKELLGVKD